MSRGARFLLLGLLGAALSACGPASSAAAGGPVNGPVDHHCFTSAGGKPASLRFQPTSMNDCHAAAVIQCSDNTSDAGSDGSGSGYGPTRYNSEADDDDCKYRVGWSSTPIRQNQDVTFTVSAIRTDDGGPLTGAGTAVEVFLDATHPAPNSNPVSSEVAPGLYTVGPVRFDAPGQWTVRFHFYEQCTDLCNDSPHGHAAFYIRVP